MPKLTKSERVDVLQLIQDEEKTLIAKATEVAGEEWEKAEVVLASRLGMSDDLIRAAHLREQIQAMQQELTEIEHGHPWRSMQPTDNDYRDTGLRPPGRNHLGQPYSYTIPNIFGKVLDSKWNLEVFRIVNDRMNILEVHHLLNQTGSSVRREITLSGTFEEVRLSYYRFYELLRKAGGKEIPPLLSQIIEMPLMLPDGDSTP